jgi:hypothetical protein
MRAERLSRAGFAEGNGAQIQTLRHCKSLIPFKSNLRATNNSMTGVIAVPGTWLCFQ